MLEPRKPRRRRTAFNTILRKAKIIDGLFLLWPLLGWIGTAIMISRAKPITARTIGMAVLTLPHATIFGGIWLLIMLISPPIKRCPFCMSYVHAKASACPKCTRTIKRDTDPMLGD